MLAMLAASRVYVSSSQSLYIAGLGRQSANGGQHDAGTGRLHGDLCLVFCRRVRSVCDYFLPHYPAASSSVGWIGGGLGWRWGMGAGWWNGGSSVGCLVQPDPAFAAVAASQHVPTGPRSRKAAAGQWARQDGETFGRPFG
jgi:hypothetical protein